MSNSTALETTPIETEVAEKLAKIEIIEAAEFSGAMRFAQRQVDVLSAQIMRGLETFQETGRYRALGYNTFVEYLEKHPSSPMTKNQYYERKKLLELEGDAEFDLLNSLNVPAKHRKLLTAGDVVLDGDQLIIGDKSVAINDAKGVRKAIAKAVASFEQIEAKSSKLEKENEKLKKRLTEAESRPTERVMDSHTTPEGQAMLSIIAGFADLEAALKEFSEEEFTTFKKKLARRIDKAVERWGLFLTTHTPGKEANGQNPTSRNEDGYTDEEVAKLLED